MWVVTGSNRLSTMKMNSPKRKIKGIWNKKNLEQCPILCNLILRVLLRNFQVDFFFLIKKCEIISIKSSHGEIIIWESWDRLGTLLTRRAAKAACQTDFYQKFASLLNCILGYQLIMQPHVHDLSFSELTPLEDPIPCPALEIRSPGGFRFAKCI